MTAMAPLEYRALIHEYYREVCAECGATEGLEVHHVAGGGSRERRQVGSIYRYRYIWEHLEDGHGDDYELLCKECHMAKTGDNERPIEGKRPSGVGQNHGRDDRKRLTVPEDSLVPAAELQRAWKCTETQAFRRIFEMGLDRGQLEGVLSQGMTAQIEPLKQRLSGLISMQSQLSREVRGLRQDLSESQRGVAVLCQAVEQARQAYVWWALVTIAAVFGAAIVGVWMGWELITWLR